MRSQVHRILGPARYRGWALKIESVDAATAAAIARLEPGPHYAKHWTLGHALIVCLAHLVRWRLTGQAPDALRGERVLKMRLTYVRGEA